LARLVPSSCNEHGTEPGKGEERARAKSLADKSTADCVEGLGPMPAARPMGCKYETVACRTDRVPLWVSFES
jgi:hypothetical protein